MSRRNVLKNYEKGMTVQEIKDISAYNSTLLFDIKNYLNEDGTNLYDTYEIIEFEATFAGTIDELVEGIEGHINNPKRIYHKANKEVTSNLKHFCKNFLDREITIKEERS